MTEKSANGTVSSDNETTVKINRKGPETRIASSRKENTENIREEKTKRMGSKDYGDHRKYVVHKLPKGMAKRYRIIKSIGKGTFGEVFMAEDRLIGRIVAIKELLKDYVTDLQMRAKFKDEAHIAGCLGHPNIVTVLNVEEEHNKPFIIMEYLGGGNLDHLLNREQKPFNVCQALDIMTSVLSGLDAAHNMLIVHSDIKPTNIIFGAGGIPKITDFGISRISSKARRFMGQGKDGNRDSICGTPAYMSPEQAGGLDYDCRSDIYSAGVVMYRMLSGKLLFDEEPKEDGSDLEGVVCGASPLPLSTFRNDVPEYVEELMRTMLEKSPNKRFQSSHIALMEILKARSKLRDLDKEYGDFLFNPTCPIVTSPTAILADIINLLLVDGEITSAERVELSRRAEKLGIGETLMRSIEIRIRLEKKLSIEKVPGSA